MKFLNAKALTNRLLVALALATAGTVGFGSVAEAATCFTCHAPVGSTTDIRPVESTYRNITTGSIKGSHLKHIPAATTLASACTPCHGAAVVSYVTKHRNGLIEVPSVGYSKTASFAQSGNPTLGTCSTASCHVSAYSTNYVVTTTWGVASGCSVCHTGTGAFTGAGASPATGSHSKHMSSVGVNCASCHTGASAGITGGSAHLDGNVDVIGGYTLNVVKHTAGSGYSSCTNAACHVSSYANTIVPTTVWGVSDCAACHSGVGAFTGTGMFPTTGSHTKHQSVGAACATCHTGASAGVSGGAAHRDGNIDVVGGYTVNVTKHTAGSGYSACTNASCHTSPYSSAATNSPTWGLGGGCVSCHTGVGAFTGTGSYPTTGSHTKHQASGAVCANCHTGATAGLTGGIAHTDGNIDVVGGYPVNVTKHTSGSGYSRCSAASCHADPYSTGSTISPTWGVSTACGECHVGVGAFTGAGTSPTTGSHTKHQAGGAVCANCHAGATAGLTGGSAHIDGNIDVIAGYTANVTKHAAGTGYKTCSAASCHASPYGTSTSVTPTWGNVAAACTACHNGVGSFSGTGSTPTTGSHTKHQAGGAVCANCHTGATAGVTGGTSHLDGHIDVTNGYPASVTKHTAGSGYSTCNAASCHANPYGTSMAVTPTWGAASAACAACHNGVGAFSGTGSYPTTGSHTKHQASGATCANCHTGATAGVTGGAAHTDGNIDVIGGYPVNVTKHAAGSGYSRCSTATCHADPYSTGSTISPTWGVSTSCGECHVGIGAFTGTGSYPATGSHTKHQAIGAVCANCHTGATAGLTGGVAHTDGNIDVVGGYPVNVTKHAAGSGYSRCSTASCHADPYSTGSTISPTWGVSTSCGECHVGVGAFTGTGTTPTTGSHTKHQAGGAVCANCHTGATAGVTGGTSHLDGHIDVTNGYPVSVTKHAAGSGYSTCNAASCHANPYGTSMPVTPTWGTASAACAACHNGVGSFSGTGSTPTTGSHTKHQAGGAVCANCHTGATAGVTGGSAHTDGNIDVTNGYTANVTKHTAGSGYSTCNAASCHANPYGTSMPVTPTWGTVSAACAACHNGVGAFSGTGSYPTTGSHTKHQASGATCAQCHTGATAGVTGGAAHTDGNIDVVGGYPVNVTKHAAGSGYSRCSTATCHADPYSTGNVISPTWGVSTSCGECHVGVGAFTGTGTSPTTGSHSKHQAGGAVCANCHTGATAGVTGGTSHLDGHIDVTAGYPANVTKHTAGSGYSTCNAASCHANVYGTVSPVTPTWGDATVACAACHNGVGAFTGTGLTPTTGSHTKHQAGGAVCANCHTGATAGVTGGSAHKDGNIDVINGYTANVTKHTAGSGYGSCNAASCHANPYGTSMPVTPTWGNVAAACAACHNGVGSFTGAGSYPTTGSHTKHQAGGALCGDCHTGATAGVTGGSAHTDGNIDVTNGYTANVTKHTAGSGYKTCSAASCHANPYGTAMPITPTWGNVSAACAACHNGVGSFSGTGSSPTTGSHTKHQASGAVCANCHTGATAAVTGGSAHTDGNIDVIGGYPVNVTKHTAGSGYSRCSTASCHADPYSTGSTVSPTWGVSTSCGECHVGVGAFSGTGTSPTTGSHSKHQAGGAVCANCHTGATAGVTGGTAHIDGNIDVVGGYTANVTKHSAGSGYKTCNAASCHASPYGTSSSVTPTWGDTAAVCTACHNGVGAFTGAGSSPATGRHTIHFATNLAKAAVCANCHAGATAGVTGGSAHTDGNIDVIAGYTANVTKHTPGTYAGSCSTAYCHGYSLATNPTYPGTNLSLPAWNTPFLGIASTVGNGVNTFGTGDCAKCHGYPPMDNGTHIGKVATDCIKCHPHVNAAGTGFTDATLHVNGTVEETAACADCHAAVKGARVDVMQQFTSVNNSHHYQGTTKIDGKVCYACHWEANSDGSKNTSYHGKTGTSVVDLVIWNATTRPTVWSTATGITYLSGGATNSLRTEMAKITTHCTGCHGDLNKTTPIFATDNKTPSTYSWEAKPTTAGGFGVAQSIGAKYLSTVTTPWGKYTGKFTNNKGSQTKAYSAHNNAANNARGWSTLAETLQGTAVVANFPNTSGSNAVLCFDCHNSHGSSASAASAVTSSYSSATGSGKGGILKMTIASTGGYTVSYKPGAAGSTAEKNAHKAGAGLCFDCHNNANTNAATLSGSTSPWGYTATFGASQAIYGYNDTPYFGKSGGTFAKTQTYTYTAGTAGAMNVSKGSHFGASSTLINTPDTAHQIGGICTPCHDPHGVSPAISTPANAVPLLKGTFVTSPYKVDVAGPSITRGGGSKVAAFTAGTQTGYVPGYHIDQNTMQTNRTMKPTTQQSSWLFATSAKTLQTMNSTQFAGLCEKCHTQSTLNSTAAASSTNWKSSGRIHNSVAGWASTAGGNANNKVHAFTCSKCHTTHNSRLPRLLVTNCLDVKHAGRVVSQATVARSTSLFISTGSGTSGGRGRFPGGGGGAANIGTASAPGPWYFGNTATGATVPTAASVCHESTTAGSTTFNPASQIWNTKSQW